MAEIVRVQQTAGLKYAVVFSIALDEGVGVNDIPGWQTWQDIVIQL